MSSEIGRLALSAVGAVAGFIVAGPFGASIGLAIGAGLGFLIFPPEGKTVEGPRLDDLKVSFSTYGKPIPRIFGVFEVGGNYVWSTGLIEHRVKEEAGKGMPSTTFISFLYTSSWRIQYGVGPAQAILKNWADLKLIRDRTGSGPTETFFDESGPGTPVVRDFLGTTTQLPGPAEQADIGIADVPAYRGTIGQEWEDIPLENYGNRIPNITAEVAMSATETFPFKRITPPSSMITQGGQYSANVGTGYVINKAGSTAQRISFVSQTVVNFLTYAGSTDVAELDDLERIWGWNNLPSDNVDFRLYEAETGKLISSSPVGTLWLNGVFAFQFMLLDGGLNGAIVMGSFGRMIQLGPGGLGLDITHIRDHNSTPAYTLSSFFSGSYPISGSNDWTVDGNGDPWLAQEDGSDGALIRFDKVSANPVEKITLTGKIIIQITYYADLNSLILREGSTIHRFSLDSKTITSSLATTLSSGSRNDAAWQVIKGRMYLQEFLTGNMGVYDVSGDSIVRLESLKPNDFFGTTDNWEGPFYDPINEAIILTSTSGGSNDDYGWIFLNRATGNNVTVRFIVEAISALVDYTTSDIDATELTDTLPGYIVRTRMTARKALEPLATAFNWRSVESDFKIKFPKRGKASVASIPEIDLGATAGETPTTQPLEKTRIPEDQLFETVTINYIDPTFDNNPNTQIAKRIKEAIDVGGSLEFNFPGALGNDQAAQIAERMLFQAWSGRTAIATSLPLKHILLDPGDVITITKGVKTVQLELHQVDLGINGVIKIRGTIDDSAVHTSTAVGGDALGDEDQVIVVIGSTDFFILDIPLLRDLDDGEGLYVGAGTPEGSAWPGAQIFRGVDTVSLFPFTGIVSTRNLDYGHATTVLADAEPDIWDRISTLTLNLTSGALSSDTEINILNGANTLLVGSEVIQFATAILNSNGTYTISVLLRGRRGTDFATSTHVIHETVIVLSSATLLRVDVDLSDHLSTFFYRAKTLGSSQFSTKIIEQKLLLRSQMPYAPSHVQGILSGGDWTFTHIRQTRVGGAWRDFVDVPLSEGSEKYEWDIMDGTTVKRILTSVTESVIYTAAQQTTDFGGTKDPVTIKVFQLSDEVGRGFVRDAVIGS